MITFEADTHVQIYNLTQQRIQRIVCIILPPGGRSAVLQVFSHLSSALHPVMQQPIISALFWNSFHSVARQMNTYMKDVCKVNKNNRYMFPIFCLCMTVTPQWIIKNKSGAAQGEADSRCGCLCVSPVSADACWNDCFWT